ncbi:MAG TPA: hypothetical protein PLV57_21665 [Phycisphaerae bacterium]|nr:hypothetical protein [Phycisphaerae bacterium]HPP29123.1 hypothetical protein [Phycisphaerae bacterium]
MPDGVTCRGMRPEVVRQPGATGERPASNAVLHKASLLTATGLSGSYPEQANLELADEARGYDPHDHLTTEDQ